MTIPLLSHLSQLPFAAVAPAKAMSFSEILWRAYATSDFIGKSIVLLLLLFSMYAWIIICSNVLNMLDHRRKCEKFLSTYEAVRSPLAIGTYLDCLAGPLKNVCYCGLAELCNVLNIPEQNRWNFLNSRTLPRKLEESEINKIRAVMNKQINSEVLSLEQGLPMLSMFVTVSPFLGLFGTVWGVMATFMAIAQTGSAELTAIAPGISGALLTTVAGLTVAIPSVVANIFINSAVNKICLQMDIFLDDYLSSLNLKSTEGDKKSL